MTRNIELSLVICGLTFLSLYGVRELRGSVNVRDANASMCQDRYNPYQGFAKYGDDEGLDHVLEDIGSLNTLIEYDLTSGLKDINVSLAEAIKENAGGAQVYICFDSVGETESSAMGFYGISTNAILAFYSGPSQNVRSGVIYILLSIIRAHYRHSLHTFQS